MVGYYTLSAYTVRLNELPTDTQKKLPRYPLIPATLLGRLAISQKHQGQKLGRLLLMDALHRSWKSSTEIASAGIVVDALDENARQFNLHYQFVPLEESKKLFLPMQTVRKAFQSERL